MEVEGFEPSRGDCLRGAAPAAVSATPETKRRRPIAPDGVSLGGGGSGGRIMARLAGPAAAAGRLGSGVALRLRRRGRGRARAREGRFRDIKRRILFVWRRRLTMLQ